jgi:hypothetical protein
VCRGVRLVNSSERLSKRCAFWIAPAVS